MPLTRVPNEFAARREAKALLEAESVTTCPVLPEVLAVRAGLRVEETTEGFPPNAYGALVKMGANAFCIMLSTRCPNSGHRRFTVGHELGHFFMPDTLKCC